ncbi:MAG: hypothetical protein L3J22_07070 [Xanthomonadales bacterium]|nr:hypothetical protein [Xanthomonadales bacterium]
MQKHHWILLALLALAAGSYARGFLVGSVGLLALGLLLEGAFWVRLLRRKSKSTNSVTGEN